MYCNSLLILYSFDLIIQTDVYSPKFDVKLDKTKLTEKLNSSLFINLHIGFK